MHLEEAARAAREEVAQVDPTVMTTTHQVVEEAMLMTTMEQAMLQEGAVKAVRVVAKAALAEADPVALIVMTTTRLEQAAPAKVVKEPRESRETTTISQTQAEAAQPVKVLARAREIDETTHMRLTTDEGAI